MSDYRQASIPAANAASTPPSQVEEAKLTSTPAAIAAFTPSAEADVAINTRAGNTVQQSVEPSAQVDVANTLTNAANMLSISSEEANNVLNRPANSIFINGTLCLACDGDGDGDSDSDLDSRGEIGFIDEILKNQPEYEIYNPKLWEFVPNPTVASGVPYNEKKTEHRWICWPEKIVVRPFTKSPSFATFSDLPFEIRRKIWAMALPQARVVVLSVYDFEGWLDVRLSHNDISFAREVFACKESWNVFKFHYHRIKNTRSVVQRKSFSLKGYFDGKVDILLAESSVLFDIERQTFDLMDFRSVENLALGGRTNPGSFGWRSGDIWPDHSIWAIALERFPSLKNLSIVYGPVYRGFLYRKTFKLLEIGSELVTCRIIDREVEGDVESEDKWVEKAGYQLTDVVDKAQRLRIEYEKMALEDASLRKLSTYNNVLVGMDAPSTIQPCLVKKHYLVPKMPLNYNVCFVTGEIVGQEYKALTPTISNRLAILYEDARISSSPYVGVAQLYKGRDQDEGNSNSESVDRMSLRKYERLSRPWEYRKWRGFSDNYY